MAVGTTAFTFQKIRPDPRAELGAFRDFLKANGRRVTRERLLIAEAALQTRGHFGVDDLHPALRTRADISKASIYRTIPILIESGLLAAVYLENGHMHYERAYGRELHCHMRCTACGRIFEFSAPELSALEAHIAERERFKSEGHKFEIWGLCAACAES